MLKSAPYADSWAFLKLLNRDGIRIVFDVWGRPAQFTHENDRLGTLQPAYYDDYIDDPTIADNLRTLRMASGSCSML
jgi:hypothetical protein